MSKAIINKNSRSIKFTEDPPSVGFISVNEYTVEERAVGGYTITYERQYQGRKLIGWDIVDEVSYI